MCGIVGTLAACAAPLPKALAALAHRGPDGEGSTTVGPVWLGHRRLSIIDLSEAAAQPMHKAGCGVIAFNGEIYDHAFHRAELERDGVRFDTSSDTEVLLRGLAARGPAFLQALHGMYAFAWLEPSGRRLWLARDHMGMKPLYLWRGPQGVAFASEVRALAVAIRGLGGAVRSNAKALADFLAWGAVPEPACVLDGAEMVPADGALAVSVDAPARADLVPTGRLRASEPPASGGPLERVRGAVRAAVSRHLVSDRPVALFLSSGIDSGVLAAELSRAEPRPVAISVILGSRGTSDEPGLVRSFAGRLGMRLETVALEDLTPRLEGALGSYDQPSVDGLNTYLVAGVARDLGYKVALSGVGADEVFGGYRHLHRSGGVLPRLPGARLATRLVGPALAASRWPSVRRAGILLDGAARGEPAQRSWRRVFPEPLVRSLLPEAPRERAPAPAPDPLELEQATYLRDTLLRDADAMGMAWGVEIRAPYLDPDVLATARDLGTPAVLSARKPPKWLLREGWSAELDPAALSRGKTGFTLDVSRWLRASGTAMLEDGREVLRRSAFVHWRTLDAGWEIWRGRLESGHPAAWVPLFALVQLAEQLRRWGDP